jgi:Fe-S cluster assembly protein SufD
MNLAPQTISAGVEGFLGRFEGLRAQLPGDPALREAAASSFRELGFPGRRDEAWKYTNLRPVAEASFQEPLTALTNADEFLARLPELDSPRLVFVDGRFRADLSVAPTLARSASFADQPDFGTLFRADREPMVALNTMLAEDGAVVTVPAGVDAGLLQLVSIATGTPGHMTAFHPRHMLRVAEGARLDLVEISLGDGAYLHNPVTEVHVGSGAVLSHCRLQDESRAAFHLSTLYAEIAEGGTYDSFTLNLGSRVARTEAHACLAAPHGVTHLNGAQLIGGRQHADFTTVVRHVAPHGTSRQTVKNVLAGRARAVFQGRIEVARAAQKTDGYQMNQSLLLSAEAEIDTKPELEIFADDVKCSHGATVGELDAEQLFYLRSRGISDAEARSILVRAFLAEALEAVANEQVRAVLEQAVARWWEGQAA